MIDQSFMECHSPYFELQLVINDIDYDELLPWGTFVQCYASAIDIIK